MDYCNWIYSLKLTMRHLLRETSILSSRMAKDPTKAKVPTNRSGWWMSEVPYLPDCLFRLLLSFQIFCSCSSIGTICSSIGWLEAVLDCSSRLPGCSSRLLGVYFTLDCSCSYICTMCSSIRCLAAFCCVSWQFQNGKYERHNREICYTMCSSIRWLAAVWD